jgi:hypothetical protein
MLVFIPRWKWTSAVAKYVVPAVLAIVYLTLLLMNRPPDGAGFGSLAQVERLFSNPWLLLAGWVHYLAFDLFIGAWELQDAQRLGIRHWYLVPCLLLTFLVGPVGLLLYLAIRGVVARKKVAEA